MVPFLSTVQHIRLRPRPHVSGDFCICKFFYADKKISVSTRSVYDHHMYPIRIWTSQRISQQSILENLAQKKTGSDTVTAAYTKITYRSFRTYLDTQRIQKFPLRRAYTEISGYTERIRRTCEDARCIRIKKFVIQKSLDTCGRGLM